MFTKTKSVTMLVMDTSSTALVWADLGIKLLTSLVL